MTPLHRGVAVTLLHCLLVLSIAGKYAIDRERLPRVWARTVNYDPDLPVRGRYVSLRVAVEVPGGPSPSLYGRYRIAIRDGHLVATPDPTSTGEQVTEFLGRGPMLAEPVAFFLPEHAPDPTLRAPGEELWVEVSVPRKGPPRPIRLGVKKNGTITPLDLR
jgi:hypothetical protein